MDIAMPPDLSSVYEALHHMGARIQSHSWGMSNKDGYGNLFRSNRSIPQPT